MKADASPVLAAGESAHCITLADRVVPYVLRRSARRTIGLSIDHRGLRASAPQRASLREVEALIGRHAGWVTQKLDEWYGRPRPEKLRIVDGVKLPLFGEMLEVRLASGANRAFWSTFPGPTLTLCLRQPTDAGRQLEKALRSRAQQHFAERVAHFSAQLGVKQPPIALSSARTRWGSCNPKTGIRLNWRLIHFPLPVVDYVVVHELAHLRELNHSRRFWAIVESICPDWREQRQALNRLAAECPGW